MKNILFLLLSVILFSSCGNDPEGVWQNDKRETDQIVIIQNETGIAVRLPNSRQWINFITIGGDEYMSRSNPNKLKFVSNNKMQFTSPRLKQPSTYSKKLKAGDASVVNYQMTRKQVRKLIGEPKEITEEKLAEKWTYESGLILLFDDQGVFKVNGK